MARPSVRGETGFTLIELMITVVILGVISSVLATSIIVGLRTTGETMTRFSESHDAQLVAAYFVPDVQSSDSVSLTDTSCSAGSPLITPVVSFQWTDASILHTATYLVQQVGSERRLNRRLCTGSAPFAFQNQIVVVHTLGTTGPAITCAPSCTATPLTVSLTVTAPGASPAPVYSYSITGLRRKT